MNFFQNNNISAATPMLNSGLIYTHYMIEINLSKRSTVNMDNIMGNIIKRFLVIKCLCGGKFWWRKRILNIIIFLTIRNIQHAVHLVVIFLNHKICTNFYYTF